MYEVPLQILDIHLLAQGFIYPGNANQYQGYHEHRQVYPCQDSYVSCVWHAFLPVLAIASGLSVGAYLGLEKTRASKAACRARVKPPCLADRNVSRP